MAANLSGENRFMRKESFIRRQSRRLTEGEINRRRFVMSVLATGVTLPTALSLASRAEARTPRRGGLLRYGTGFGARALVPDARAAGPLAGAALALARGNCLTEIAATGRVVPDLAESWEPAYGGRTWVFALRRGVTFHDGRTLTAGDVAATMRAHLLADAGPGARPLLGGVATVRADGGLHVIFELAAANADFPALVSDHRLTIRASGADALTGTGAYRVTGIGAGGAVLERNPAYFKPDRAHFDRVEVLPFADAAARQAALMNGEADVIDDVDPRTVALLGRMPELAILETAGTGHCALVPGTPEAGHRGIGPALKRAIDRQELVDRILLGHGHAGSGTPVGAAMPYAATLLPASHAAAGPLAPVRMMQGDFAGAPDTARLIQRQARAAGIAVGIHDAGRTEGPGEAPGWHLVRSAGRPAQGWMFATDENDAGWSCAAARDLVATARTEADPDRRRAIYAEAQRREQAEGDAIVLMWANDIHAHRAGLGHAPEVGDNLRADGGRIAERWWIA